MQYHILFKYEILLCQTNIKMKLKYCSKENIQTCKLSTIWISVAFKLNVISQKQKLKYKNHECESIRPPGARSVVLFGLAELAPLAGRGGARRPLAVGDLVLTNLNKEDTPGWQEVKHTILFFTDNIPLGESALTHL